MNGAAWSLLVPLVAIAASTASLPFLTIFYGLLWVLVPAQRAGLASYQAIRMPPQHLGKVRGSASVIVQLASIAGPFLGLVLIDLSAPLAIALLGTLTAVPVVASSLSPPVHRATLP